MKKKKPHKTNAIRILEKEKIAYEVHEYPWSEEHLDTVTVAEKVAMPLEKIYKTLVTRGDKAGIIVACIPANHTLDLKSLAKVSGNKKMEMLPIKELESTTGYIRGGCSPIGMKKTYPTYIAINAHSLKTMIVSAGKRGRQVELTPGDLQKVTAAVFSDFTVV
ncbi:Cys-tRNA(Pro) deacylase [Oceanobacillus chungangensis]|uniref:Cys-tRNA(Pro)/Cys-tRNA(Cys) deacylase n=1 Tax=Oceanobacillus chungangensis TaxID=1229152 RepID=A0A3D8PUX4_9BACI|nr:Cys-tRNA(Pro) deacylase [Oceanobacillus chungangensis]RDW19357.1 Cys-tRNA(Pro) deacylase [Oceanobacillus chungangensis]